MWYDLWFCWFSSDVFSTDTFSNFFFFFTVVVACLTITPTLNLSYFPCSSFSLVCSLNHMVTNHLKDKQHWALRVSWGHILNSFVFFLSCNIQDFGNTEIAGKQKIWGRLQPTAALYFVKLWGNKEMFCLWKTLWQLKKYGE